MVDAKPSLSFLAVDGGGTRCRVVLVADGGRHDWEGGGANVSSDFEGATQVLLAGVHALSGRSGITSEDVFAMPAYLGLAGVTGAAMVQRLEAALPFTDAVYSDDRPTALRGALGQRDGAVAHCGTGSFFATRIGGEHRFAGGWGPVLGDEASAQWLGRRLLAATLETVDRDSGGTPLTESILKRFGDAAGIIRFAGTAGPEDFGGLAPLVTESVARDDPTGCSIMQHAAAHVEYSVTKIGWRPGLSLCLTGGLGPHYASFLPEELQAHLAPPEAEPIEGAVALAHEHAQNRQS